MTLVSVVTGGAGAMGSACARAVAPEVDALILTDRDERRLTAAAETLEEESGASVSTVVGDIVEPPVVAELARRAEVVGELHSLVHTAGVSPSMAGWRDILQVDLAGVERLLNGLLENVVSGSVAVCLASISGHLGSFDPEMDAILDAPLRPRLRGAVPVTVHRRPRPGDYVPTGQTRGDPIL